MKITTQPNLLSKYKNQGTKRVDIIARMQEQLTKAKAAQKRNAAKVTNIKRGKK